MVVSAGLVGMVTLLLSTPVKERRSSQKDSLLH